MGESEFAWVLPSTGDSRFLGTEWPEELPTLSTLRRVAVASEEAGFDSVLVTTGSVNNHFGWRTPYLDSIVAASSVVSATRRLRLLVALRTGAFDPVAFARIGASLDVISDGRFMLNIVSGGSANAMVQEELQHGERYARTEEQIEVLKALWTGDHCWYSGRYIRLKDAFVYPKPVQKPHPAIYLGGQSEAAQDIAARHADCILVPGMSLDAASEFAAGMRARCAREARAVRLGIHFYVITRPTDAEAGEAGEELLSRLDPAVTAALRGVNDRTDLKEPVLWSGLRRLWGGSSMALRGSYQRVADAINDYRSVGFSTFIFSAFPLESEARRFGTHVLGRL